MEILTLILSSLPSLGVPAIVVVMFGAICYFLKDLTKKYGKLDEKLSANSEATKVAMKTTLLAQYNTLMRPWHHISDSEYNHWLSDYKAYRSIGGNGEIKEKHKRIVKKYRRGL